MFNKALASYTSIIWMWQASPSKSLLSSVVSLPMTKLSRNLRVQRDSVDGIWNAFLGCRHNIVVMESLQCKLCHLLHPPARSLQMFMVGGWQSNGGSWESGFPVLATLSGFLRFVWLCRLWQGLGVNQGLIVMGLGTMNEITNKSDKERCCIQVFTMMQLITCSGSQDGDRSGQVSDQSLFSWSIHPAVPWRWHSDMRWTGHQEICSKSLCLCSVHEFLSWWSMPQPTRKSTMVTPNRQIPSFQLSLWYPLVQLIDFSSWTACLWPNSLHRQHYNAHVQCFCGTRINVESDEGWPKLWETIFWSNIHTYHLVDVVCWCPSWWWLPLQKDDRFRTSTLQCWAFKRPKIFDRRSLSQVDEHCRGHWLCHCDHYYHVKGSTH